MKLKLVVASMSVLGLVSCPVFAATDAKHKHHRHHHRHHHVVQQTEPAHDYKDMGSMPVQTAAVDVCTVNPASMTMDATTQNLGRAMPNPCNAGWYNRVQLSGGINVDLGKWGNRNGGFMGVNYQRLSLNDVYLNVAANVNEWVRAFASFTYNDATALVNPSPTYDGEYSAAATNNINTFSDAHHVQLDQAFATFGWGEDSPFYFQVGKQYQEFGHYELRPITRSFTQVMSETLATSAKLGFIIPSGFHGSIYVFDDPIPKVGQSKRPTNYGAALGYDTVSDQLGWGLGAAYLYNIIGVNDTAYMVEDFTAGAGYNSRVAGLALYGDLNSGPFNIRARYTTALQRFNPADLPANGVADLTFVPSPFPVFGTVLPTASGARPWTADIQVGYGFEAFGCKNNNIFLGYQASREAAGLALPRSRWALGFGMEVYKNSNIGIEWDYDTDHSVSNGGRGGNYNLVSLRAGVQFG